MVWMIGGPGSGKGTQSTKIARKYGFVHIDPCALVQKEVQLKGPSGEEFEALLARGFEVPLADIVPLIEHERAVRRGKGKGVVIDGYPTSLEEAEILETSLGPPDIVIALEVVEEVSTRRTSAIHHAANRPSLAEYAVASVAVIEKYDDILLKVDSSQNPDRIFDVIQFNIDQLNQYQKRISGERRSSHKPRSGSIHY